MSHGTNAFTIDKLNSVGVEIDNARISSFGLILDELRFRESVIKLEFCERERERERGIYTCSL